MKKLKHDASRAHALDHIKGLCVHAILHADEFAQAQMTKDQREEIGRLLIDGGAHLELVVRIDDKAMRAELRLVEQGTPAFPDPLLQVESTLKDG